MTLVALVSHRRTGKTGGLGSISSCPLSSHLSWRGRLVRQQWSPSAMRWSWALRVSLWTRGSRCMREDWRSTRISA